MTIDEADLGRDGEPDVCGILLLTPHGDDATAFEILVVPGLPDDLGATFAVWAEQRLGRFFEHGPEPDGWQRRTADDGWQLWARLVDMPPLD